MTQHLRIKYVIRHKPFSYQAESAGTSGLVIVGGSDGKDGQSKKANARKK